MALKPDGDRELVDFVLSEPCAKEGNLDIENVVSLEMQGLVFVVYVVLWHLEPGSENCSREERPRPRS